MLYVYQNVNIHFLSPFFLWRQAPTLHSLRVNTLQVMHSQPEEFINYDLLTQHSGRAPVYPGLDQHRTRAKQLTETVNRELWDPLAAQHIGGYLMLFEFSFPPALATLYNITSVHSPDLAMVIKYKFKELFAALPNVAGVLIYVADNWSPRAGYEFQQLWSTAEELSLLANMYYDAVVATSKKDLWFSLWSAYTVPGQVDSFWPTILSLTEKNVSFSVDDTNVDFMVNHRENTVLLDNGAAQRRMNVVVDVMRQYNGWGRALALPAKQWGRRMLDAWHQGAVGAQAMGCWSEAAVWADKGIEIDNYTATATPPAGECTQKPAAASKKAVP